MRWSSRYLQKCPQRHITPALIVAWVLTLTGCSVYDGIVHKQATSTFDDVAADQGYQPCLMLGLPANTEVH